MIPNSIQWRLQIWYGLVLFLVLAGLGLAAYELERGKLFQQIDNDLRKKIKILADALNGPPPREDSGPPEMRAPPTAANFHLLPPAQTLFTGEFYFTITGHDGQEIARSQNAAATRAPKREITIVTPTHERILVGRFIAADLAALHRTAFKLAAIGGIILLFGLAIGWRLVSRALRPIADISATAEIISTGDLTQRINVAETNSELGRLAAVLNSAFARLETAFALQKRFAADAAHELRTPVSVLLAQTRAALVRQRSYEENLQTIEACQRVAQRMRQLIVSLLQLARLDAGQEIPKRVKFDLLPVASECVELLKPLAAERGVKLILEAEPVEIIGDAEQIHQVIVNLLTNAIQYNQPGGEARVKTRFENGNAVLAVSDTGIGISAGDLPHVFERFYRADQMRSSSNAGLGLAISKAIVAAHGGTIEVASRENAGTIFTARLPFGIGKTN